ncbi:MAG: glycosyltransferase family 4 protein, partial [Candidatus Helarchaeota archaeon]
MLLHYYSLSDIPGMEAHQLQTYFTTRALSKYLNIRLYVPSNQNKYFKANENLEIYKLKIPKIKLKFFKGLKNIINNLIIGLRFLFNSFKSQLPDFFFSRDIYTTFILVLFKIFHKRPLIYEMHLINYITLPKNYKLWDEKKPSAIRLRIMYLIISRIEMYIFAKVDKIITITSSLKKLLKNKFYVPSRKIEVIPDGTNIYSDKILKEKTKIDNILSSDVIKIIYLGSLYPWKGVQNLIIAGKYLKNTYFNFKIIIVGGFDNQISRYRKLIKKFRLENEIILTGYLSHKKAIKILKSADIAVLPYSKNIISE